MTQDNMTAVRQRMQDEQILWMATTRPDGRPHVAPVWFVWHEDRAYVMTGGVKLANVRHILQRLTPKMESMLSLLKAWRGLSRRPIPFLQQPQNCSTTCMNGT